MSYKRNKVSRKVEDYYTTPILLGIVYDRSLYDSRSKAKVSPIEEVERMNLPPFFYENYRTTKHIPIVVTRSEENVIIDCIPLSIFTYADTYYGAVENFKSLLIDYYNHLQKRKKKLAKNLLADLEYLKEVITAVS